MKRTDKGSILVEAIVMIGLISALTPVLYKHVSDRRSEVEDINKANTFLLIQRETERYLKENRGNVASGLLPLSNIGLSRLDSKYVIGIRKQDDDVYAMIAEREVSNGGNDMKAGKVASLIGVSAGIYSSINSANAYGINGVWIEKLDDYYMPPIPTGSVIVTTQYNQAKQIFYTSDMFVDSDIIVGNYNISTSGNIKAAAFCLGADDAEVCIKDWYDQSMSDLGIISHCNAGEGYYCKLGYERKINRTCSAVDEVYKTNLSNPPEPKIYSITYGTGSKYEGYQTTICGTDSFSVSDISTLTLPYPVSLLGGTAFGIPETGWYQIAMAGEMAYNFGYGASGSAGLLAASIKFNKDNVILFKAAKGWKNNINQYGGAGVLLFGDIRAKSKPILAAGGGSSYAGGSGGLKGGSGGYSWNGSLGWSTLHCSAVGCNIGATGGGWANPSIGAKRWGGSGTTASDCNALGINCFIEAGGNISWEDWVNYPWNVYGHRGKGYVSIHYCGPSATSSLCQSICKNDSECTNPTYPYCEKGFCDSSRFCEINNDCETVLGQANCVNGRCVECPIIGSEVFSRTEVLGFDYYNSIQTLGDYEISCAGKYKIELKTENSSGSYLRTEKYYNLGQILTAKIAGSYSPGCDSGAAALGIQEDGVYKLVVGGTPGCGGGNGWVGGCGNVGASDVGVGITGGSWSFSTNSKTTNSDCNKTWYAPNCSGGGSGCDSSLIGKGQMRWFRAWYDQGARTNVWRVYGGTGLCASGYTCSFINGANSCDGLEGRNCLYQTASNTMPSGAAFVKIYYCGPNESYVCP